MHTALASAARDLSAGPAHFPGLPPGRRIYPLSAHYRRRFGGKVYKVSVSTAQTCPNREGLRGMRVCSFCDEWGSAAYPERREYPLGEQVRVNSARIRERYRAERFLVYFQAYTNTFARVSRLEALFESALALPGVVGIVVGTRPDCLPPGMIRRLAAWARRTYVSVELGIQTLDDAQLRWLSRGHDRACSLAALEALRAHADLEVCAHLMFGLPGETDAQLRDTARTLGTAGLHGVKLHNLHVLRGTPLAALYRAGRFEPVTLAEYADKVATFLEYLPPSIAVHRLSAVASRWEDALAPAWVRHKLAPAQAILDNLERRNTWQGRCCGPSPVPPQGIPATGHPAAHPEPSAA
jgi:radical SAM protein (TIGR01212 family)